MRLHYPDVDCSGKNITDEILADIINKLDSTAVEILDLKKNKITTFDANIFVNFTKLQKLHLDGNSLTIIVPPIKNIPNLTYLDLSFNQIKTLKNGTFNGLNKLTHLYLRGNDIETVDSGVFDDFMNLEDLFLIDNKIIRLLSGTFTGFGFRNTRVFLHYNKLTTDSIQKDVFGVPILNLLGNNLTTIRKEWFASFPEMLVFAENPMVCDCALWGTIKSFNPFFLQNPCSSSFFYTNSMNCSPCIEHDCQNDAPCQVVDKFNYNCSCSEKHYGK